MSNDTDADLKANKNITLMIVLTMSVSVLFLLPRNIYIILRYSAKEPKTNYLFSYITLSLVLFSYGLNMLIYVFFNKLFRKILFDYFKWNKNK
jgi:hypothetical protein